MTKNEITHRLNTQINLLSRAFARLNEIEAEAATLKDKLESITESMCQLRDEIKTNPILYLVKKPEPPIKTYYVGGDNERIHPET
jgi:hypothetical protein